MEKLFTLSAKEISRKIKKGEMKSREVVSKHIERIKEVNPEINAIIEDRFDEALKEAEEADSMVEEHNPDDLPPLWGVPCTIKEAFAVKGMHQTGGLVSRKDYIAQEDSTVVKRIRDAGAIILGITNVPELGMWMESYNKIYGLTRNPYNLKRTAGGSSGGEGAIIGAGGSPFGIGSDLGGSIRMPAFFNGIFGHKPTGGLVPNTGQYPSAKGEALKFLTPGPLSRKAEDLFLILKTIAGPDGKDPVCKKFELKDPSEVKIENLKVYNIEGNGAVKVSKELIDAQRKCSKYLLEKVAEVKTIQIKKLKYSLYIWSAMLSEFEEVTFTELMGEGKAINPYKELIKWIFRISPHTLPAISLCLIESLMNIIPSKRVEKILKLGKALKQEITEIIGDNGVILYPSYPVPAPRHYTPLLRPFRWIYTAIINVLEFPSTQVPLGLNRKGLPLGVQVIAPYGMDHLSIAVATELEKKFGGWVPPEG